MKQHTFQTIVCKLIAANKVKSVVVREMLLRLAVSGACRPCLQRRHAGISKRKYKRAYLHTLLPDFKHEYQNAAGISLYHWLQVEKYKKEEAARK